MAWSDIFLPSGAMTADEQAANLARQQADYARRLEEARQRGQITDDQAARDFALTTDPLLDQNAAAWQGAAEGAAEGWQNVLNAPGRAVGFVGESAGTALGGILKGIPWWAWLAAGGFAFFYLGGGLWLRGRLNR